MSVYSNNIGVPPPSDGSEETPTVSNQPQLPRRPVQARKDFKKIFEKDGDKDDEDDQTKEVGTADVKSVNIKTAASINEKPKRPSPLSLAAQGITDTQKDSGNIAMTAGRLPKGSAEQASGNIAMTAGRLPKVTEQDSGSIAMTAGTIPKGKSAMAGSGKASAREESEKATFAQNGEETPVVNTPKTSPSKAASSSQSPVLATSANNSSVTDDEEEAFTSALLALATQIGSLATSGSNISADEEAPATGAVAANGQTAAPASAQKATFTDADVRALQNVLGQQVPAEDVPKGKDSPFAVYKNMKNKDSGVAAPAAAAGKPVLTRKETAKFGQAQGDPSYVSLAPNPVGINAAPMADAAPVARAPYIQEIITQMVDSMTVLKTTGTTETTITIKNSPVFNGAQLTLTGFDSANKEFNISFQNLSPAAKQLLDLKQNQTDLKMAMAEKGFTVHIIITTTETENYPSGEREQQGDAYGQGSGGQRQQQSQDSDEQEG